MGSAENAFVAMFCLEFSSGFVAPAIDESPAFLMARRLRYHIAYCLGTGKGWSGNQ
jgi:hypothetical protein